MEARKYVVSEPTADALAVYATFVRLKGDVFEFILKGANDDTEEASREFDGEKWLCLRVLGEQLRGIVIERVNANLADLDNIQNNERTEI